MTVNALATQHPSLNSPDHSSSSPMIRPELQAGLGGYTESELVTDPLLVLRCVDARVYGRCPPLVEVLLRVLDAFLSASRTHLNTQIQQQVTTEIFVHQVDQVDVHFVYADKAAKRSTCILEAIK